MCIVRGYKSTSSKKGDRMKHYKLTLLASILILVAILMPASDVPSVGIPNIDKLVHFGMFGTLALCYYGEYVFKHKRLPKFLGAWIVMESFALLTEIMQLFVEGRSCDGVDWIADSIGILGVIVIFRFIYNKKIQNNQKGV